jgi:hypothetical protein
MLRARLATDLLFNVLLALWVLHDARTRRARKPFFASALTLLWGPLGLGLWASDRPLAPGETRHGVARTIAGAFLLAWAALLPAIYVLVVPDMLERSAVPGSFPQRVGVNTAAAIVTAAVWGGPAIVAFFLGRVTQRETAESGQPGVTAARPSLGLACLLAGAAALVVAASAASRG